MSASGPAGFHTIILTCCAWIGAAGGCTTPADETGTAIKAPPAPPPVRVLLTSAARTIRLRTAGGVSVRDSAGKMLGRLDEGSAEVACADAEQGLTIGDRHFEVDAVRIVPADGASLWFARRVDGHWEPAMRYPGTLLIRRVGDGGLDVINRVAVEDYVACVVAREIPGTFHREALLAQSIIARTYVLDQMLRRRDRSYDVTATQASQVYRGYVEDAVGSRAAHATGQTRGLVCVARPVGSGASPTDTDAASGGGGTTEGDPARSGVTERIFPTYYSAACGGLTQTGAIFGHDPRFAPLAGAVKCDHCRIAPEGVYRWGPVDLAESEVRRRLARGIVSLKQLGRIVSIEVAGRSPSGRPYLLRIRDARGGAFQVQAEAVRRAIGSRTMRSTNCRIVVAGNRIRLEDGHGFGHGVGLCQWGMEALARQGRRADEILAYYYPTSRILRAY